MKPLGPMKFKKFHSHKMSSRKSNRYSRIFFSHYFASECPLKGVLNLDPHVCSFKQFWSKARKIVLNCFSKSYLLFQKNLNFILSLLNIYFKKNVYHLIIKNNKSTVKSCLSMSRSIFYKHVSYTSPHFLQKL